MHWSISHFKFKNLIEFENANKLGAAFVSYKVTSHVCLQELCSFGEILSTQSNKKKKENGITQLDK